MNRFCSFFFTILLGRFEIWSDKGGRVSQRYGRSEYFCGGASVVKWGLAVLYKDNISFSVVDGNKNAISGMFLNYLSNVSWHVSFIYGDAIAYKRIVVWNYLRDLRNVLSGPWLILGDFNAISSLSEKEGGNPTPSRYIDEFVSLMEDLEMADLGYHGPAFTWSNNRLGAANIRERIDRVVANVEWLNLFPPVSLDHVTTPSSIMLP
ncbi:hypothetical protein IFM89_015596 [Coptis chinensis]|uniref:Endonuclease/exonuclease/phosphatase domain-containing protein n=1 Tax=Coptis chinensis TaxID=261450 RepID=A0A835M3G7_9MAGN|nr:hypothetical protein IFM89_015596 [Coptis chinensis]